MTKDSVCEGLSPGKRCLLWETLNLALLTPYLKEIMPLIGHIN